MSRSRLLRASCTGTRSANEDFVDARSWKSNRRRFWAVVACDGVGSQPGSGVCARDAGQTVMAGLQNYLKERASRRDLGNSDVASLRSLLPEWIGRMRESAAHSTTCCIALSGTDTLICAWAGDTRAYALTCDGALLRGSPYDHCDSEGRLTHYVSGTGAIAGGVDFAFFQLSSPVAAVCVTTDGVHEACSERELRLFLAYAATTSIAADSDLERELAAFLGVNASDNFSMSLFLPAIRLGLVKRIGAGGDAHG